MATPTYEPIATYTFPSSGDTRTFSSIPSTYTDLEIRIIVRGTSAGSYAKIRVNGDSGTNYSYQDFYYQNGASTTGWGSESNKTFAYLNGFGSELNSSNTYPLSIRVIIPDYSSSSVNPKTIMSRSGLVNYAAQFMVNSWRSASAINSIQVYTDSPAAFAAGTIITLYGIKAGS